MTAPAGTSHDPFSIFEDALWGVLEAYKPLTDLVLVGNRVKLTGSKDNPYEASSLTNDYPELQISPAGANVEPGAIPRTSDTYFWEQRYSIGMSTDTLRTNVPRGINALKWHVLRALVRGERTLVKPAIPFVTWIKPGDFNDQLDEVNRDGTDRRQTGWKAVLGLKVQFQWAMTELLA